MWPAISGANDPPDGGGFCPGLDHYWRAPPAGGEEGCGWAVVPADRGCMGVELAVHANVRRVKRGFYDLGLAQVMDRERSSGTSSEWVRT